MDLLLEDLVRRPGPDNSVWLDRLIRLPQVHASTYGRLDAAFYDSISRTLLVIELATKPRSRLGPPTTPDSSSALSGVLLEAKVPVEWVELVVVQPRIACADGPVRSHRISPIELLDFQVELREGVLRAQAPDAPLNCGSWCRFCLAAHVCPELKEQALLVIQKKFSATDTYNPDELAVLLVKLALLETYVRATWQFAHAEILSGKSIPGWKIVQKPPIRRWAASEADTADALELKLGIKPTDAHEITLKSPDQIERLLAPKKRPLPERPGDRRSLRNRPRPRPIRDPRWSTSLQPTHHNHP